MDPRNSDLVAPMTGPHTLPALPTDVAFCVHHSGRHFRITFGQASVFVRKVDRIMDEGGAELVPLLHENGVELLHVSAQTPLQIHDVRDHSLDLSHN